MGERGNVRVLDAVLDAALDELIAAYTDPTAPQSARIAAAVAALPFFQERLASDDDE